MQESKTRNAAQIIVSIPNQTLTLWINGQIIKEYPISSSKFGLGFKDGSFCTPTGRFRIASKIGSDQPLWMVFKARQPTGKLGDSDSKEDQILSRILRLDGLESANSNTYGRFIYIHGTNQEDRIGQPASHGCIRMKNADIADLFTLVNEGDLVEIQA